MKPGLEDTLASIALSIPGATRIFSRHRLDYCCGGAMTLEEACGRRGIKPAALLAEISTAPFDSAKPLTQDSLASVIDYVIQKHHVYTREIMEEIHHLSSRVVTVHGDEHPELVQIRAVFLSFEAEMGLHLRKEEEILFPHVKLLEAGRSSEAPVCFPTVQGPIRMMLFEHDTAAEQLRRMRQLSNDYALPESACTKYRILYQRLPELEADVHEHMHLENNLLFPRAAALEAGSS